MDHKIPYTLAATALKSGLHALRFNFRGAGRSEGVHNQGRGETEDTLFLAQWMRELLPGARMILAGFSFGAYVSLKAAVRAQPDLQVSIAPPFRKYFGDAPMPERPPCPWLVVHGVDDEIVDYGETMADLAHYAPSPEIVSPDGVGHFFHGRQFEISNAMRDFMARNGFPQPASG